MGIWADVFSEYDYGGIMDYFWKQKGCREMFFGKQEIKGIFLSFHAHLILLLNISGVSNLKTYFQQIHIY